MAIYDYLPKFGYIEPNNLKGLQPGFVVAQMDKVASDLLDDRFVDDDGNRYMFENGKLCSISDDGIVAATAESRVIFIHYTEPLNTIINSDQYFAVNIKEECPRLVQLIPGDEWMSNKDLGEDILGGRIIKMAADKGWYSVGMPNGEQGYHYMFLG